MQTQTHQTKKKQNKKTAKTNDKKRKKKTTKTKEKKNLEPKLEQVAESDVSRTTQHVP